MAALNISTHSPRAGRTPFIFVIRPKTSAFQLTRPVRGEPLGELAAFKTEKNFNSLAPCGANQSRA